MDGVCREWRPSADGSLDSPQFPTSSHQVSSRSHLRPRNQSKTPPCTLSRVCRSSRTKYSDQLVVKAQNSCQSLTWLPITCRKLAQEAPTCKPALRSKPQNWNCCKFTTKRQFTTKTKRPLSKVHFVTSCLLI